MSSIETLNKKAKICLAKKSDIPMSPLFNMANAAKRNTTADLKYLQDALDFLTCKAKSKMKFTSDEKEFLKEIYEAFWWGGRYKGLNEAAQLANHYVNGEGNSIANPYKIDATIYKTSKIVIATMNAMKIYISAADFGKTKFLRVKCDNVDFRSKVYSKPLLKMNYQTEGKMKSNGVLEAAQNNQRLHKADGHFYLESISRLTSNNIIQTTWRVDSLYDFEPFEKHDYYTEIPLGKSKLILSDGLSEYMTRIGVANSFWYRAEWSETWNIITQDAS
jgi:hypothetical protein